MSTGSHILSAILQHLKKNSRKEGFDHLQFRRYLDNAARNFNIDPEVSFDTFHIDRIPSAWLTPPRALDKKVLLYLHGGGFNAGSIKSHRDIASRIAKATRHKTLVIEYRLAPEHPFPAGLDDALDVYRWLLDHGRSPDNIVIAGDSAGGNLALSLMLKMKSLKISLPSKAVLISPWLDVGRHLQKDIPAYARPYENPPVEDPMLYPSAIRHSARIYTGYDNDPGHPFISPLNGDLAGLPPMLIQAGTHEILFPESVELERRAKAAGVPVSLEIWEGMFHVWHYFARYLLEGRQAIDNIGNWVDGQSGGTAGR
ncbi:MAG: alpha/beta hydrolase [Desulfamplus sp.]|nr:alpha/beta hydrolase [Desulfamplus sp.]